MFHFGFIWFWEIEAEISLIQSVSTREKVTQKENLTTLQFWIIATRCSLQNMKVIAWFKSRHKKIVSPWRIRKEYKEQALNIKVHYFWSRKGVLVSWVWSDKLERLQKVGELYYDSDCWWVTLVVERHMMIWRAPVGDDICKWFPLSIVFTAFLKGCFNVYLVKSAHLFHNEKQYVL